MSSAYKRSPRPKEHQVAVRMSSDLLELIDAEAERLRAERLGAEVHRSDAIREILYRALRADKQP